MTTNFDELPEMPKKNAFQQIQEQIEHQMRPFRQIVEMQNLAKRHSLGYQQNEALERLFEPYRNIQKILGQSAISKHLQDFPDVSSVLAQSKSASELYFSKSASEQYHLENTLAGIGINSEAIRRLAGMNESIRQAAGIDFASDFARKFTESTVAFRAIEEAQKSRDSLLAMFRNINFNQFESSEDDAQENIQAAEFITRAATNQESIQKAVDLIVSAIQSQRKPAVQLMLWMFFLKLLDWLIAGAIGAAMGHYTPTVLGESPQAAKKSIQESARAAVGTTEKLVEYRYVSAKTLSVRQNPKARSPEIGRLPFGRAVKLLKKEKDFALVIWTDKESGAEIQGWVFSRYLGKFN